MSIDTGERERLDQALLFDCLEHDHRELRVFRDPGTPDTERG